MMSFPAELLAVGVILLFGLILFLVIRTSRRQQLAFDHQLQQLGFQALETPPPELERRVAELYQTRAEREIELWRVYHRRELDQDLYVFDAVDISGDSSDVGSAVFGMISRNLALPRFSMVTMPDFDRDSLIGGLMDKILDKVLDYAEGYLQLERIEFPDRPELDDQIMLFGRNPAAVREILDRVGLYSLTREKMSLQIAGSGDFITVDFTMPSSADLPDQGLVSRYQTFVEISRKFMT
jgi:hypothetical protein